MIGVVNTRLMMGTICERLVDSCYEYRMLIGQLVLSHLVSYLFKEPEPELLVMKQMYPHIKPDELISGQGGKELEFIFEEN